MSDRPGIDVVYQENRALEAEIERLKERIKKLEATLRMRWPFDVPLEADDE